MPGALFEERFDGSDLGLHAGIAGEHRIDRLSRVRCEARLAPERLRAIPQGIPCRQVGRIGVRLEAMRGDAPAEFHERPRTETLHLRPQRIHGLAHPVAFVGGAGQAHTRRIVELRALACQSALKIDPLSACKTDPLSGTAEVVPVVNRGDPRGFV